MGQLARNPDTKEVIFLDKDGSWKPAQRVVNPQTQDPLVWDGDEWKSPPLDVGQEILKTFQGVNRAIARTAGAPVDLMQGGLNLGVTGLNRTLSTDIPYLENAFGGSQNIKSGMEAVGIRPDARPQTATGRVLNRTLEEVTAAGLTMGIAGGLNRAAQGGAIALGPRTQHVTQTFASQPGAQFVGSAGAGVGAGIANEMAPGSFGAEVAGIIGGGAVGVGLTPAVRYLWEGGKAFVEPLTRSGREAIVGRTLNTLEANKGGLASGAGNTTQYVPGSQPTTAQALNDPGLAATERALRNNPEAAARFNLRDDANIEARTGLLNQAVPQGAGAEAVQANVRGQVEQYSSAMGEAVDLARQNVQRRLEAIGPGLTEQQAGVIIREEYDTALNAMRQQVRKAYQAIDPEGTSRIPTEQIHTAVAGIYNDYFGTLTKGTPEALTGIAQRLRGGPQTFAAMDQMAKEADNVASMARAQGDNLTAAAAIDTANALRGGLDDAAMAGTGFTQAQRDAYQQARALRRDMGQRLQQGATGRAGAQGKYGEYGVTPGEVPALFFNSTKGSADDAQQFMAAFGGDRPRAVQALKEYAVGDLYRTAVDPDGTVNPQRLRSWIGRHSGALNQFPELRRELMALERAQLTVDSLVGRQARTLAEVQKGALGGFVANPEAAVAKIMSKSTPPSEVMRLRSLIGNDEVALAGLRRAVLENGIPQLRADFITDTTQAGVNKLPWITVKNYINQNRQKLALIFEPAQLRAMEAVALDMARANASGSAGRVAGSNTIQNLSSANLIARLTSGGVNLTEGGQGLVGNTLGFAARFVSWAYSMPEAQVQRLLVDAMMDPKLAKALAAKPSPQNLKNITDMLVKRGLVTSGVAATGQDRQTQRLMSQASP
jgi:hypothetical protein